MSDPIRDLESFAVTPTSHLDAAEVRRRGDQRRRRRTAAGAVGAVAAVAVIVSTGAVLATGTDDRSDAPPATTTSSMPSPSATSEKPTSIPQDFPIAAGWEDAEPAVSSTPATMDLCGTDPLAGLKPLDVRTADMSGGEALQFRTLYLLGSPKAATAAWSTIMSAADACQPTQAETTVFSGAGKTWGGDGFITRWENPDFGTANSIVHLVVTVGPALLVTGYNDDIDAADQEQAVASAYAELADVVTATLQFGDLPDGYGPPTSGTGAPDPAPNGSANPGRLEEPPASALVGQGDIGDLDLTRDFTDNSADGGEQKGPSADLPGIDQALACGAPLLSQTHRPTGRLLASNSGPEFFELRQVIAYRDAKAAKQTFNDVVRVVSACTTETIIIDGSTTAERTWQVFGSGDPDSIVFADTPTEGLGGSLYRVSRFGRSLLVMMQSGEWSTETVGGGLPGLDRSGDVVRPMLCSFTQTGC